MKKADEARKLVSAGTDPSDVRREARDASALNRAAKQRIRSSRAGVAHEERADLGALSFEQDHSYTFEWLYESELLFDHFLIQQIDERMFWLGEDWAAHRTIDVDGRVARALVGLFHPRLRPHRQSHIELSQEEVANLAGVSRPRCNRALKPLQDDGLLKLEYGGLTVLDLVRLRHAAVV